ncbi:MAG: GTPase HflX [Candidatus Omnitrophica bacterium 4484_70.2]|nr:MAG: GTPase HflX [Candidatus Omnitrophica bacterium 4484_70.2]
MYETVKKERALLVVVTVEEKDQMWPQEEIIEEFRNLVFSTGIEVGDIVFVKISQPTPTFYIGKGKTFELAQRVHQQEINVVIFNNNLSYTQQKNLEEVVGVKVIDRTQLILDIFAKHAHTQEGALQVELAQLEYLLPRLKGKGIMLSRLGGGIGTRGPGEKKLEVDKRRIFDKISRLRKELAQVRRHREVIRKKRQKEEIGVCSLVGYTNAGKTTLLNVLVGEHQNTSNSLFTTLDPVSRILWVGNNFKVVITDTVGFLYRLPPNLIEAFKATLEELKFADLLLHIVDVSNKNFSRLIEAVSSILKSLELEEKKMLLIFNKIDKITQVQQEKLKKEYPEAVFISALKKINLDALLNKIYYFLSPQWVEAVVKIPFSTMEAAEYLYNHSDVVKVEYKEKEAVFLVKIKRVFLAYLRKKGVMYKEFS